MILKSCNLNGYGFFVSDNLPSPFATLNTLHVDCFLLRVISYSIMINKRLNGFNCSRFVIFFLLESLGFHYLCTR
jgi:hypothetical protein